MIININDPILNRTEIKNKSIIKVELLLIFKKTTNAGPDIENP